MCRSLSGNPKQGRAATGKPLPNAKYIPVVGAETYMGLSSNGNAGVI